MSSKVEVHEREVWIVNFLNRKAEPQTVRAIWEAAQEPPKEDGSGGLDDDVSLPTYHRTVNKLVRRGQLEEASQAEGGAARYAVSEQMSPLNTYTLTDLNGVLWEMSFPEAFAQYVDALDYYETHASEVLAEAARGLLQEDPRELVERMLRDQAKELEEDLEDLRDLETAEPEHRSRTENKLRRFKTLVHGWIGLSGEAWDIPTLHQAVSEGRPIAPHSWEDVRDELEARVYGDAFIERVRASVDELRADDFVVAGSDGSSHAGFVRGVPAPAYAEEEGRLVMTFNNSLAYVDLPDDFPERFDFPYHGVPMTRSALEDPNNRGMVLSRPWFPNLQDSEYEHMKKAALDVVQFRVDERLITGRARSLDSTPMARGTGGVLPRPHLLIRDGTVTPQEREFQHYNYVDEYGEIVREGIQLSHSILRAVMDSKSRIFAGAVKSTQLRTFTMIVNWYIQDAVDPTWDTAKANYVNDSVAVTRLLRALPELDDEDAYYRTCVIARPFPAMVTGLRGKRISEPEGWSDWFERAKDRARDEYEQEGGNRRWILQSDVEDDPYLQMCQKADYAMFYFGKPGEEEPHLTFPRFEFMDALRRLDPAERRQRVRRSADAIVSGVHATKWSLDRDHSLFTQLKLPRLVPHVVYEAHEKCKVWGHKLESELRQAIAAHLSKLKELRGLPVPKVEIEPIPLRKYVDKMKRLLGPGTGEGEEEPVGDELE